MNHKFVFPRSIMVGGQKIDIVIVNRCDDNALGSCLLGEGVIRIANTFNCSGERSQSATCKMNTLYHEITHAILGTMGEVDLNNNERFVNCFSSFLAEAMDSIIAAQKQKNKYF